LSLFIHQICESTWQTEKCGLPAWYVLF